MLTILSIVFLHDDSYRPIAKLTSSGGGTPILVDARTRSARIDFLRGVAIFAVLLLHFSLTYNLVDSPLSLILPAKWVRAAVGNGNYGVTIFFVISGFLITSNNLFRYGRLRSVSLRQFYAFRFSRI